MKENIKMLSKQKSSMLDINNSSHKRKTTAEYKEELLIKNPNVIPLEEYVDSHTKILHFNKLCGHEYYVLPTNVLKGCGCKKCADKHNGKKKKKTMEQYIHELEDINPDIEVLDEYIDFNTKIRHKCLICNHIWYAKPPNILNGCGCPKCAGKNLSTSDFAKMIPSNIKLESEYLGAKRPIMCSCIICGNQWTVNYAYSLKNLKYGCMKCAMKSISSKLKFTHDDFYNRLKNISPNIELLEQYSGMENNIKSKCLICDYTWYPNANHLVNGCGCPKCAGKITKTHDEFIASIENKINENIQIIGEYKNTQINILVKCKICNREWYISPTNISLGCGCKSCKDKQNGIKLRLSKDDFLSRIDDSILILDEYKSMYDPINCQCKICGYTWVGSPPSLAYHKSKCPSCNKSNGENLIKEYLQRNNINFVMYKKFDDLLGVGNRKLSYDFYIGDYNLLIEFQGKQHAVPIKYFGGEEKFKIQQEHDIRKRKYANDHNINLLEIWYDEINDIEMILNNYLNNLKLETLTTAG